MLQNKKLEKFVFQGEVLLCDDSKMIQEVMSERLSRAGLKVSIAENGKEGIEMVKCRIRNRLKPFDLIFMDIHMPVMGGVEAATEITKFNSGVPIVAVTPPNVTFADKEQYVACGISDCLNKPFTYQELSTCLLKYLTPLNGGATDKTEEPKDDAKIKSKLIQLFIENNKTKYEEIVKAIDEGDIVLAHRLAHVLKSNAGMLGKTSLQRTASDIENILANGRNEVDRFTLDTLKTELKTVLNDFRRSKQLKEAQLIPLPELADEEVLDFFYQLESLLIGGDIECLNLIDILRSVPGSDELIQQIENFEFDMAIITLAKIKANYSTTRFLPVIFRDYPQTLIKQE